MTQIAVFSDQPILLQGFERVLGPKGFEIIATASPSNAEDRLIIRMTGDSLPELILLDITAGLTFGTLSAIHKQFHECPVVLWADQMPLDMVFKTLEFGVRGIVARTSTADQLVESLRKVAGGELQIGFTNPKETQQQSRRAATLTPPEREIITLLRQGLRNKQIAGEMGITEGTVKIYLFRLFHKLGVRNRFELASCGILDQLKFSPGQGLIGLMTSSSPRDERSGNAGLENALIA